MNIKLYDIGRADCVLLRDKNSNLLIDCGVKKDDIATSVDINNDLSYSENHLMITHYHDDHIRGLDHIYGDVIDVVYISRFPICLFQTSSNNILKQLFKLYAYTPSKTKINIYLKNIFRLYKKISNVIKSEGVVTILNKGDNISHVRAFEVIHPDLSCDQLVPNYVLNHADHYIKIMEQSMNKTAVKKVNQYASKFASILNAVEINEDDMSFVFNKKVSKDTIKAIDKILFDLKNVKKGIEEYLDFEAVNKAFSKYMNNNSLVIHNEDILFTGDVTRSVITSLHSNDLFHKRYKVIKLPFHGSNTHYSMNLPYADFFLSCSDSTIWDINEDSQYLNLSLKSMTIFSNGDVFHNGHIFYKFYDGQIKINL